MYLLFLKNVRRISIHEIRGDNIVTLGERERERTVCEIGGKVVFPLLLPLPAKCVRGGPAG